MPIPREKRKCPICGDPGPFILWVDDEPPSECPYNPAAKNVTECAFQMKEAKRAALWRREVPEAFDAMGKIKPDGLYLVLTTLGKRGIDPML